MEDAGILTGYHASVEARHAGYPVAAFVRITVSGDERTAQRLVSTVAGMSDVMECHRCTGDHAFILKVQTRSVEHLEQLIDRFTNFGMTSTSLILSSPVRRNVVARPPGT
jgi:Lrp/AsnC family leucine-responsive transcriptional regulator